MTHVEPPHRLPDGFIPPSASINAPVLPRTQQMSARELAAMRLTAELADMIATDIITDGDSRTSDINEFVFHIHAIQRMIMSNVAARAHPDLFRPLGGLVT